MNNPDNPATPGPQPHGSPHLPQRQIVTTTLQAVRTLTSSTQTPQDLSSFREALRADTRQVDVVSIDDLLEAIYGKVDDLDEIRKKLVTRVH